MRNAHLKIQEPKLAASNLLHRSKNPKIWDLQWNKTGKQQIQTSEELEEARSAFLLHKRLKWQLILKIAVD